ncbi:NAD kinase [Limtongia smithiae]|uniref:NAD kinase n=1 Tax=Limtongia smithiae TaxID=1125753 RepID=UPI0034CE72A2
MVVSSPPMRDASPHSLPPPHVLSPASVLPASSPAAMRAQSPSCSRSAAAGVSPFHPKTICSDDEDSSDNQGGFEVLVDPRHRMTSRRRRASMINRNGSVIGAGGGGGGYGYAGFKMHNGGCLLHALLDTERETRRRSIDLLGGAGSLETGGSAGLADGAVSFEHSVGGDEDEEAGYVSSVDMLPSSSSTSQGHALPAPGIRRRNSLSPPPEFFMHPQHQKSAISTAAGLRPTSLHELLPNAGFSRHLTKQQLGEIAFSVRDLSKYLGTLRIKMRVRKIVIVTKLWDRETVAYTKQFVEWLLAYHEGHKQYTVYVEEVLKDNEDFDFEGLMKAHESRQDRLRWWSPDLCKEHPQMFDLVVTLGGDGTVLYTSRLFQRIVPPVLSFNLGSLGFLTKFEYTKHDKIMRKLLTEGVVVSLRMRFECTVMKSRKQPDQESDTKRMIYRDLSRELLDMVETDVSHEPLSTYSILNDIVVDRGPNGTMCTAELYVDDEHITTIEADGLVIATPTGSTAYSLSAGGSLVHPDIPGMLLSPICAHSLSFRPLIVPDNVVLRIGVPYDARTSAWCSFDGKDRVELFQGDYITISASRFPFPMIQNRKLGSDWFESLSTTLSWNQRKHQKAFDV